MRLHCVRRDAESVGKSEREREGERERVTESGERERESDETTESGAREKGYRVLPCQILYI